MSLRDAEVSSDVAPDDTETYEFLHHVNGRATGGTDCYLSYPLSYFSLCLWDGAYKRTLAANRKE